MSKTILITGASSGIGKVTAKLFQEKGWNVVATMRKPEKEEELTKLENVFVTKLDVLDKKSIKDAVAKGIEKFGKIDVLLNNAGYGAFGILEAASDESIRRQFDVNVFGLLDVTKAVLPHFRKNQDGMIINISSMGGKITFPLGALYHGTKFAVEGISEALHFELEAIGVKVKIIEPGNVETDFGGRSLDFFNDESLTEYQESVSKILKIFETLGTDASASKPNSIAKVVYKAAIDGTNTLRYIAGEDAKEILLKRKRLDDETFINGLKADFGL